MTVVTISQPFFMPWLGFFEQLAQSDVHVHYTDVAFSKGSFVNRVQIKTARGQQWMTLPLKKHPLGTPIDKLELAADDNVDATLRQQFLAAYQETPYVDESVTLLDQFWCDGNQPLHRQLTTTTELLTSVVLGDHFANPRFCSIDDLNVAGSHSQRVLDVVKQLGGTIYLTGWGARNYLDHEEFESQGVEVRYVNYSKTEYPQLFPPFTPYVTCLDMIANVTAEDRRGVLHPRSISWRDALDGGLS